MNRPVNLDHGLRTLFAAGVVACTLGLAKSTTAQVLVMPSLTGAPGTLKASPSGADHGMGGAWTGDDGLRFDKDSQGLIGRGWAQRDMVATLDFRTNAEWFFSVRLKRNGTKSGGSDHASVNFFNKDRDADLRPLQFGISSQDRFMAKMGDARFPDERRVVF
ncbi:MAG: hypothetical protein AAGL98_14020 [Planctomycetota bacterium]